MDYVDLGGGARYKLQEKEGALFLISVSFFDDEYIVTNIQPQHHSLIVTPVNQTDVKELILKAHIRGYNEKLLKAEYPQYFV